MSGAQRSTGTLYDYSVAFSLYLCLPRSPPTRWENVQPYLPANRATSSNGSNGSNGSGDQRNRLFMVLGRCVAFEHKQEDHPGTQVTLSK